MFLFKRRMKLEDFIENFVGEIISTDNKVDISNAPYMTLKDIKKIKEYLPIFRLHLLLLMITTTSKDIFDLSKRFSIVFDSIKSNCIKYGLSEDESKVFCDKVYSMQENYEKRLSNEKNRKSDIYFHSCCYFVDLLFPDEDKMSDKVLANLKMAKQIYKGVEKAFNSVKIV